MSEHPFTTAATEWLKQIQLKRKLNKESRRAVMSFSIWLDNMIEKQQMEEDLQHDKEN